MNTYSFKISFHIFICFIIFIFEYDCKVTTKQFTIKIYFKNKKNILPLPNIFNKQQNNILQKQKHIKMNNNENLDDTDRKILRILQRNSDLTVKELAAKLHLSTSPTFERQKRLERDGYIERYMAVVNPHKVGNGIMVLCNIRLKQHSQELIQEFMDVVQNLEEITECYNTSGDYDFLIKVYARDMKSYQQFMLNTLGTIDCIGSLHSIFVIDETKNTHAVPISTP